MMKIAVTGGSGKLGRTVVAGLREAGHEVLNVDVAGTRGPGFLRVDLTNYGEVIDTLFGENDTSAGPDQASTPAFDALVHLAAIPASAGHPERCRDVPQQHPQYVQRLPGRS